MMINLYSILITDNLFPYLGEGILSLWCKRKSYNIELEITQQDCKAETQPDEQ